jgi:hypothetical protein
MVLKKTAYSTVGLRDTQERARWQRLPGDRDWTGAFWVALELDIPEHM